MNRLRWLITIPVAIIVVVLAVNNRGDASLNLWPLDLIITWPLFAFVFIGAGAGFVLGAALMWITSAPTRRRARERASRIRELERAAADSERASVPAPVGQLPAQTD
ncbi:MAG: lipopolysaccharide assembly protein LapA domain-containing protein [Alphaproteobacteria bacterium]